MKKLLTIVAAGMILAGCTAANATKEPPDCNDPAVRKTLGNILRNAVKNTATDLKSDTGKRWCTVRAYVYVGQQWASTARMWYDRSEWRDVTYTIEWVNEAERRFSVETK